METFTAIFTQLGVDSSLLPQFFIITAVFVLANFLFLGKLQQVIELREEKTVKLESSADELQDQINTMQAEYKSQIEKANREALRVATEKKSQLSQKYTNQFKQVEKEVTAQVDKARSDFSHDLAQNKHKYIGEADSLAQSLVNKILQ